ncbi:MAG: TauD/TfdA family dioxygenase [Gammaproteobacteria bacterium]
MSDVFSARQIEVPQQQEHGGVFPLVFAASAASDPGDAFAWLAAQRESLLDQVSRHGAVLFRDFGVNDAEQFDRFVRALDLPNFTYADSLSNAVRINMTDRVFTANEAPPDVGIFLHHEMAQTPIFPSRLFFYCEQAAAQAGQTPLCRSDALYNALREALPAFVDRCEQLGVKYSNTMPASDDHQSGQGRSWRSTLGAQQRDDAERKLQELGYSWEWLADESLAVTSPVLPAVRQLHDGRKVFFNQLIAAYLGWADSHKALRFGDDSAMDQDAMQRASDIADALTFDLAWQSGDVALVDNHTVMHGRRPFKGTRRVLVSLVADAGDAFVV